MEQNNGNRFEYTYSAPQLEEVRRIREKYQPREETKLEALRRLDKSVEQPGTICGIVIGVLGCLIMGTGMSCVMVWGGIWMVPGIAVGVLGMLIIAMAYPAYRAVTRRQREKLAPQILALAEALEQGK